MKKLVPADKVIEMTDFPYDVPAPWLYGCTPSDPKCRELLNSLLYTVENPDTPDGMMYVYDLDGLTEWYDQVADEEEREQYGCPTVLDYIACEIGRCLTPIKEVKAMDEDMMETIKQFAMFQMEYSAYGFALVTVTDKHGEPVVNPWEDFNGNTLTDEEAVKEYGRKAVGEFIRKASAVLNTARNA